MSWLEKNAMLIVILAAAAGVRFYGLMDADLHHDEISALLRTRFTDFHTLIDEGVRIDGHPALVQLFLWYWTGLLGFEPWIVKLPFVLSGILSVWIMYHLARTWFNERAAWFASAGLAVLQYGVIYSQWARPYSFGLLFLLFALLALMKFIKSGKWHWLLGFALGCALCGYTHYLALLQVVVVALLIMIFKSSKRHWLGIAASAVLAFLLWLPHLGITLGHLELGGIGDWLQPPPADYWMRLIAFSLHYSLLLIVGVLLILLSSYAFSKHPKRESKDLFILIGTWAIPYVITYYYSHEISAIMHFGTMFFLFPFLILLIAGHVQRFSRTTVQGLSIGLLVLGSVSLFSGRQHHILNLKTEYQDPIEWKEALEREGMSFATCVDLRADGVEFLEDHGIADYSGVTLIEPKWQNGEWSVFLNELESDTLLLLTTAASRPEYLSEALIAFPELVAENSYHTGHALLMARRSGLASQPLACTEDKVIKGEEFGPSIKWEIEPDARDDFFWISIDHDIEDPGHLQLVYEWISNDGRAGWRSTYLKDVMPFNASLGGFIHDLEGHEEGGVLETYLWNQEGATINTSGFCVFRKELHPLRYGLFREI